MAEARCFSKDVVLSDRFLRLSINARLLYFTLGVEAREKGILINARTITKLIGCSELDLNELVTNGYLREIEDGHFRIVHWYENNGIGETARKRNNYTYRKLREEVLARDGYACTECGSTDDLQAHHLKPFAEYPEYRFDIDNGVTLCRACHMRIHGRKVK